MNIWTEKSIDLANQRNYLDLLYKVYPMSVNLRREIDPITQNKIKSYLENQEKKNLITTLLELEVFPIKDSYVAYLKRDKEAIDRNPNTVDRLFGMLVDLGVDEIIEKATAPKETNRQIGPLFKRWIDSGALGVPVTSNETEFLSYNSNIIFNASDLTMSDFATRHLGYNRSKGLDFIAKFNNQFILAETKFLTDFGGHQNAQFSDAVSTMNSTLIPTGKNVKIISILDGVLYINGTHKMMRSLRSFRNDQIVISSVLLRDYLYSI